jgi:hypothetical protein
MGAKMGAQTGSAGKYFLPFDKADGITISSQIKIGVVSAIELNSDARS